MDPMDVINNGSTFVFVASLTLFFAFLGMAYLQSNSKPKKPKYPTVLPLDDYQPFPLVRKEIISHDTCRFVIGLPAGHILGLPIGQHVSLKFTDKDGKAVQRSYTPVSDNDTSVGEVVFVIKVYKPLPPKFPDGGAMSQHLDSLKIGDTILMKGPKGHVTWKGRGKFSVKPLGKPLEERSCQQLGMIAGGTGITPMLQILHAIVKEGDRSQVQVKLIYANKTEDDILVRQELEDVAKNYPNVLVSLWYTVDQHDNPKLWKYSTGFVDKDMIKEHLLFDNKKKTQFFFCGPPPMVKFACMGNLKELGYSEPDWVSF